MIGVTYTSYIYTSYTSLSGTS